MIFWPSLRDEGERGAPAAGVRRQGHLLFAVDDRDELRDRGDRRDGEEVRLLERPVRAQDPDQVRLGEPHLEAVLVGDSGGQGDRLEVDAPDDVQVVDGELHRRPDLLLVEPADQGRDEDDGEGLVGLARRELGRGGVGLTGRLDGLLLDLEERDTPHLPVDLVVQAVELQVQSVQARVPRSLGEAGLVGHPDAVRGDLDLLEAEVPGHRAGVQEQRRERRLPARELDGDRADRLLLPEGLQHEVDLLAGGLVDVPRGVRVREADRALQVAAVGQVHQGQTRVGLVVAAHPARRRAALELVVVGVLVADPVVGIDFHPEVEVDVVRDDIPEVAVRAARLLHDHAAVLLADDRRDHLDALRADRRRLPRKTPRGLELLHHACRHCCFPLRSGPALASQA